MGGEGTPRTECAFRASTLGCANGNVPGRVGWSKVIVVPDIQPETPWCSLITVTYNSARALEEFWGRGASIPPGVEWIVVDNGSTDGSPEIAERAGATRVIRLSDNRGFGAANNQGLTVARGGFIGFVNPDIRVDFDDLARLAEVATREQAVVAPQLLNADGTVQPNGRGFPFLADKIRNRLGQESKLAGRYLLYADAEEPRHVCWLMGAAVFGNRADIEAFGAWDPHFFLYYEDKDFCLRAWRAGIPVALVPDARWVHGWARETATWRATPWLRELASMAKFYARYPEFLGPRRLAARKHGDVHRRVYEGAS